MKKILLITSGLWLITILIVIVVINQFNVDEETYKININRIHSGLSSDWEANQYFISNLSKEELGIISDIMLIEYKDSGGIIRGFTHQSNKMTALINISGRKLDNFFKISDIYNKPAVYLPVEGSSYLVKYSIETAADRKSTQMLVIISIIITILFLLFIGGLLYIYKNIILPMKRVSLIPKQLATGYIEKLTMSPKNQYFNEFIWGLDMLREKLKDEKNRNYILEKERKTLVASLSHDIKTPLSSIKNYTIALKEGVYNKPSAQNKALVIILDKTEVIDKLTKKLLKSSIQEINASGETVEIEGTYMSEIDQRLNQIIYQKIDLLHMIYKAPVLKENLLVEANLDALSQVFDNIVENAIKYGDLHQIEVSYYIEDYYQIITIENSGKSIAENEIKHIFTNYYRGSNIKEQPGHGLGLYICKKMMQSMEGDIYAQNSEKGVKFVVVIRLAS